jgi:hypothetical protein
MGKEITRVVGQSEGRRSISVWGEIDWWDIIYEGWISVES